MTASPSAPPTQNPVQTGYDVEHLADGDVLVSVSKTLDSDDFLALVHFLLDQHGLHYVQYMAFGDGREQFILTNEARPRG